MSVVIVFVVDANVYLDGDSTDLSTELNARVLILVC